MAESTAFRLRRAGNRARSALRDPTRMLALLLVLTLSYLVLAPLASMLAGTFRVGVRDSAVSGLATGSCTLRFYQRVFALPISKVLFWRPLGRTLYVALMVSLAAIPTGAAAAYHVKKTDLPGKRWFSKLMMLPYIMPSWTFATVWITLFKNRRMGGTAGLFESLGLSPPDWLAYGALPIIACEALHVFPFAYTLFSNSLGSMDAQLEESARVVGARRGTVTRRIVAPLLLPALMSSFLLIFTRVLGSFGTPYILGSPVKYSLLPTALYSAFKSGSPGVSSVIALAMILIGVSLIAVDGFFLREAKRFVTIGVKGSISRVSALGRGKAPALAFMAALVGVSVLAPLATLVFSSLTRRPGDFGPESLTAAYWIGTSIPAMPGLSGVLRSPEIWQAAWNSLRTSAAAALLAGFAGIFVGYVATRSPRSLSTRYLKQVSFVPYLVPSIAFAAAFIGLFAVRRGPIPSLYGTMGLVVLVMSVKYLPYAARAGIASMMQLGNDPEDAARICGAPWRRRMARIVLPLQKAGLVSGVVLPFITGMKEQSLVIMLASPGTELLTTQVLRYMDYGYSQLANAVVLEIVLIIVALDLGVRKLSGADSPAALGKG